MDFMELMQQASSNYHSASKKVDQLKVVQKVEESKSKARLLQKPREPSKAIVNKVKQQDSGPKLSPEQIMLFKVKQERAQREAELAKAQEKERLLELRLAKKASKSKKRSDVAPSASSMSSSGSKPPSSSSKQAGTSSVTAAAFSESKSGGRPLSLTHSAQNNSKTTNGLHFSSSSSSSKYTTAEQKGGDKNKRRAEEKPKFESDMSKRLKKKRKANVEPQRAAGIADFRSLMVQAHANTVPGQGGGHHSSGERVRRVEEEKTSAVTSRSEEMGKGQKQRIFRSEKATAAYAMQKDDGHDRRNPQAKGHLSRPSSSPALGQQTQAHRALTVPRAPTTGTSNTAKDNHAKREKAVAPAPPNTEKRHNFSLPEKRYLPGDVRYRAEPGQKQSKVSKSNVAHAVKQSAASSSSISGKSADSANVSRKRSRLSPSCLPTPSTSAMLEKRERMQRYLSSREEEARRRALSFYRPNASSQQESDEEDEYDSDFIDDSDMADLKTEELEETLKLLNRRYDKDLWRKREREIDDRAMDSRYRDVQAEEKRSARLGALEDAIELKKGRTRAL